MEKTIDLDRPLQSAVVLSLVAHLLVIAISVYFVQFYAPRLRIPASVYRVNLVSLPPQLAKGKVEGPTGSKDLPKTTLAEAKQIQTISPPETKAMKMPAPAPINPKALAKEISRIKDDLRKEQEREAKLDAKLSSILNQRQESAKAAAPVPQSQSQAGAGGATGAGIAGGAGETGLVGSFEQAQYQDVVRALVLSAWNLPKWTVDSLAPNTVAIITVFIDDEGNVVRTQFEQSSKIAFYDESALRAIRRVSPFPAPPKNIAAEAKNHGIVMRFSPKKIATP